MLDLLQCSKQMREKMGTMRWMFFAGTSVFAACAGSGAAEEERMVELEEQLSLCRTELTLRRADDLPGRGRVRARVIRIEGNHVSIAAGHADGVRAGDVLAIGGANDRFIAAHLRVLRVWRSHSMGEVIERFREFGVWDLALGINPGPGRQTSESDATAATDRN